MLRAVTESLKLLRIAEISSASAELRMSAVAGVRRVWRRESICSGLTEGEANSRYLGGSSEIKMLGKVSRRRL